MEEKLFKVKYLVFSLETFIFLVLTENLQLLHKWKFDDKRFFRI